MKPAERLLEMAKAERARREDAMAKLREPAMALGRAEWAKSGPPACEAAAAEGCYSCVVLVPLGPRDADHRAFVEGVIAAAREEGFEIEISRAEPGSRRVAFVVIWGPLS